MARRGWNHNLQYLPLLLRAVPRPCGRALDVGCGDGVFARELAPLCGHVVAIDRDAAIVEAARRAGEGIEYLVGDFMTHPFEPESFDLVVSVTSLHHMDAEPALRRMAGLLWPGGTLALLGLGRSDYPRDLPRDLLAALVDKGYRLTRPVQLSEAPRRPPRATYPEIRRLVSRTLPGARCRRHLLWRYSVIWTKPPGEPARPPRAARAAQRVLLRARGPGPRRAVELAYLGLARAVGAHLTRGERGAAVYLRGGPGGGSFVPGLSDLDLMLVTRGSSDRVRRRWERLQPAVGLVVDPPMIWSEGELRGLFGESAVTVGRTVYSGSGGAKQDVVRLVERPGLYDARSGLRLLAGPDRLPRPPGRDRQEERIAGWLELVTWWRQAFAYLADPTRPRAADLAVKLAAESARVWLWLAHGERAEGRGDALRRAARRLPEEEGALGRALELQAALQRLPDPCWDELLPLSVRLSVRVAELVDAEVAEAGHTDVALAGDAADLVPGGGLPLADWRAVACLEPPDDSFVPAGSADDPAAYRDTPAHGPYPALLAGPLLVLPAPGMVRSRLRGAKCAAADPVPFALLAGERVARFPEVRGWSALDAARRAVTEHRARLAAEPAAPGEELGLLLAAARAALFHDSVEDGSPELCVTVAEAARRLGAEDGLELYRAFRLHGEAPPPRAAAALRARVVALPAFRRS